DVDRVQALAGLGQKLTQQVVHRGTSLRQTGTTGRHAPFGSSHSVLGNPLRLVAGATRMPTGGAAICNKVCRTAAAAWGAACEFYDRLTLGAVVARMERPRLRSCRKLRRVPHQRVRRSAQRGGGRDIRVCRSRSSLTLDAVPSRRQLAATTIVSPSP